MESTENPLDLVKAAVGQILAVSDPAERARLISRLHDAAADPALKAAREADVRELRKSHTLAYISDLTGLSIGRVDQIATGRVTGRRAARSAE